MGRGNSFCRLLYKLSQKSRSLFRKIFVEPIIRKSFAECGKYVHISSGCNFSGISNIYVGDRCSLGVDLRILSTKAKVFVGSDVMFGPRVTIITGDH